MTKLNLCCGTNVFPGWINVDHTDVEGDYLRHLREAPEGFVWPEPQRKLAEAVKRDDVVFYQAIAHPYLLASDPESFDAVYIGQAIEHFNRRTEAPALLREVARVLKPGGAVKLTTPNLETLVRAWWGADRLNLDVFEVEQPAFYRTANRDDKLAYLLYGASGDDCTRENYEGHFHCYTPRSLSELLRECGLEPCTETGLFADCVDMGMTHSFAIEAVKRSCA